jgi:hypothetical protein
LELWVKKENTMTVRVWYSLERETCKMHGYERVTEYFPTEKEAWCERGKKVKKAGSPTSLRFRVVETVIDGKHVREYWLKDPVNHGDFNRELIRDNGK